MNIDIKTSENDVFPLYLISGKTLQNYYPISIAYFGPDHQKLKQWSSLIIHPAEKLYIGDLPLAGLMNFLKNRYPECSLILLEKDLPGGIENFERKGLLLPYFMQSFINISQPIEKMKNESKSGFANAARLIRKYRLTFEIDNTPEAQHNFYFNMYRPYLSNRHNESFQEVSFQNIFSKDIPFEIFHIKADNEVLSAGVFRVKNNNAYFSFLGVQDGLFDHVKKGALSATYYFLCDELHNRGFDKLYIGGSPPFVNHSITEYKARMRAQIDKSHIYQDRELISLHILQNSKSTTDFLSNSPFITVDQSGKIIGNIWIDPNSYQYPEYLEKQINRVFGIGIEECQIIYNRETPKLKTRFNWFENKNLHFIDAQIYTEDKLKSP